MSTDKTTGARYGGLQPDHAGATLPSDQQDAVRAIVTRHKHRRGPLLEVLHEVQEQLGHIPAGAVPVIADELNVSRADVHGVRSFYHHFRTTAPGRRVLRLCRAESCQAMGSRALEEHLNQRLGVGPGGTTVDGEITLEPVYCLGLCAMSPAVMLDDEVHGRVTPQRLDELLAAPDEKAGP